MRLCVALLTSSIFFIQWIHCQTDIWYEPMNQDPTQSTGWTSTDATTPSSGASSDCPGNNTYCWGFLNVLGSYQISASTAQFTSVQLTYSMSATGLSATNNASCYIDYSVNTTFSNIATLDITTPSITVPQTYNAWIDATGVNSLTIKIGSTKACATFCACHFNELRLWGIPVTLQPTLPTTVPSKTPTAAPIPVPTTPPTYAAPVLTSCGTYCTEYNVDIAPQPGVITSRTFSIQGPDASQTTYYRILLTPKGYPCTDVSITMSYERIDNNDWNEKLTVSGPGGTITCGGTLSNSCGVYAPCVSNASLPYIDIYPEHQIQIGEISKPTAVDALCNNYAINMPVTIMCSARTANPTNAPSPAPTSAPTPSTNEPTTAPTATPSVAPSNTPSQPPSIAPSAPPTTAPSQSPTSVTIHPSNAPSASPVAPPSRAPSQPPTNAPSFTPTATPSAAPTSPTLDPSVSPTNPPTARTLTPTKAPTYFHRCGYSWQKTICYDYSLTPIAGKAVSHSIHIAHDEVDYDDFVDGITYIYNVELLGAVPCVNPTIDFRINFNWEYLTVVYDSGSTSKSCGGDRTKCNPDNQKHCSYGMASLYNPGDTITIRVSTEDYWAQCLYEGTSWAINAILNVTCTDNSTTVQPSAVTLSPSTVPSYAPTLHPSSVSVSPSLAPSKGIAPTVSPTTDPPTSADHPTLVISAGATATPTNDPSSFNSLEVTHPNGDMRSTLTTDTRNINAEEIQSQNNGLQNETIIMVISSVAVIVLIIVMCGIVHVYRLYLNQKTKQMQLKLQLSRETAKPDADMNVNVVRVSTDVQQEKKDDGMDDVSSDEEESQSIEEMFNPEGAEKAMRETARGDEENDDTSSEGANDRTVERATSGINPKLVMTGSAKVTPLCDL